MTKEHPSPEDAPQIPGIHEQLVITRDLDYPQAQVYAAWTELAQLRQWWGPKGYEVVQATLDLEPEGMFHYCIKGPDGREVWGRLLYKEIRPPERLVYISSFANEVGSIARAPFSETWPLELITRVGIDERGEGTHLVISSVPTNATQDEIETFRGAHGSMMKGFDGMLDQLAHFLAAQPAS